MKIARLTKEAQEEMMGQIADGLNRMDSPILAETLQEIVDLFTELDQEDFFGTEGWKHYFNID